jgi:hypothetical protein
LLMWVSPQDVRKPPSAANGYRRIRCRSAAALVHNQRLPMPRDELYFDIKTHKALAKELLERQVSLAGLDAGHRRRVPCTRP